MIAAFDVIFVVLLIASVIYGYRKGLVKQLGTIAGFVVGIAVARLFSEPFGAYLRNHEPVSSVMEGTPEFIADYIPGIAASIMLFIIGFIAAKLFVGLLNLTLNALPFSVFNRLTGAMFSVFFNFLILSILLNFCQMFKSDGPVLGESHIAGGEIATCVMNLAPATFGVAKYMTTQANTSK